MHEVGRQYYVREMLVIVLMWQVFWWRLKICWWAWKTWCLLYFLWHSYY